MYSPPKPQKTFKKKSLYLLCHALKFKVDSSIAPSTSLRVQQRRSTNNDFFPLFFIVEFVVRIFCPTDKFLLYTSFWLETPGENPHPVDDDDDGSVVVVVVIVLLFFSLSLFLQLQNTSKSTPTVKLLEGHKTCSLTCLVLAERDIIHELM